MQKTEKVQTFFDFLTDDGKELYFHANDVAPDSYAIYRYDLAIGREDARLRREGPLVGRATTGGTARTCASCS